MKKKLAQKLLNKFPHKIRITSDTSYELLYVDCFDDKYQGGECRSSHRQVVVRTDLSPNEKLSTVIHELIHAADLEYGVELTENQTLLLEKAFVKIFELNKVFDLVNKL